MTVKELVGLLEMIQAEQQRVLCDEESRWFQLTGFVEKEDMLLGILRGSEQKIAVPERVNHLNKIMRWRQRIQGRMPDGVLEETGG